MGILILGYGLTYFSIIALGATSGIMSERSGVINIGINGMMIIGALTFGIFSYLINATPYDRGMQFVGYIIAMLIAGLFSLLHALACIKFKANQIISGTAINMLALGLALVLIKLIVKSPFISVQLRDIRFGEKGTYAGTFTVNFVITLALIVLAWFGLNKTKWGLRLKAVGENQAAADAAGINVYAKQYQGVFLSGMFAGLSGAFFAENISSFYGNVQGLGFLSLAIMILGQWRTYWTTIGALTFGLLLGFSIIVSNNHSWIPWLGKMGQLVHAIPFILTLGTLILFSKNAKAPKAIGVIYDKSIR